MHFFFTSKFQYLPDSVTGRHSPKITSDSAHNNVMTTYSVTINANESCCWSIETNSQME
jgi:hypothetical protein